MAELSEAIQNHMLVPVPAYEAETCCATAVCRVLHQIGLPLPMKITAGIIASRGHEQSGLVHVVSAAAVQAGWVDVTGDAERYNADVAVLRVRDQAGERHFLGIWFQGRWVVKTPSGAAALRSDRAVKVWRAPTCLS